MCRRIRILSSSKLDKLFFFSYYVYILSISIPYEIPFEPHPKLVSIYHDDVTNLVQSSVICGEVQLYPALIRVHSTMRIRLFCHYIITTATHIGIGLLKRRTTYSIPKHVHQIDSVYRIVNC